MMTKRHKKHLTLLPTFTGYAGGLDDLHFRSGWFSHTTVCLYTNGVVFLFRDIWDGQRHISQTIPFTSVFQAIATLYVTLCVIPVIAYACAVLGVYSAVQCHCLCSYNVRCLVAHHWHNWMRGKKRNAWYDFTSWYMAHLFLIQADKIPSCDQALLCRKVAAQSRLKHSHRPDIMEGLVSSESGKGKADIKTRGPLYCSASDFFPEVQICRGG